MMNEEDDDIECSNDISRYSERPPAVENTSLAEFVASYEEIAKSRKKKSILLEYVANVNEDDEMHEAEEEQNLPNNTDQKYRQRKQKHIIRLVHFNPETDA
jgi:hypothetical protein